MVCFSIFKQNVYTQNLFSENVIISGSMDEHVRLWDINTQKVLKSVNIPGNIVTHIAKSPVHEIIAQTSIDKTLR